MCGRKSLGLKLHPSMGISADVSGIFWILQVHILVVIGGYITSFISYLLA